MYAIESNNLTKTFGALTAVDKVSLSVNQGEIFGLLGPNGAGKTTFISLLVTMKKPTSGAASVNGFDVVSRADDVRKSIGIIFQDPSLDEELTAYENLELHAAMYGLDASTRAARINEVIEAVELKDRLHHVVKTFSGGMRRRLEIARGLLHRPNILFLDEPTIGLDPQTRMHLWSYIRKLKSEHKITVILTTHYLEEADSLCDRVAIIDHGKIVALDTPTNLKSSIGGEVMILSTQSPDQLKALEILLRSKDRAEGLLVIRVYEGKIEISVQSGEKHIAEIVEAAAAEQIHIDSIELHKPTLEDVFLHYTGKTIREEEGSAKDAMRIRRKAWGRGR